VAARCADDDYPSAVAERYMRVADGDRVRNLFRLVRARVSPLHDAVPSAASRLASD